MHTFTFLTVLAATVPAVVSTCGNFELSYIWEDYVGLNVSLRISDILVCNSSSPALDCGGGSCSFTTDNALLARIDRYLNISIPEETADQIFELVRPDIRDSDNVITQASWVYHAKTGVIGTCMNEIQSGFYRFTPYYSCVVGTLSECTDGDIANGTSIRACGVQVRDGTADDTIPVAVGSVDLDVISDGEDPGPFANATVSGEQANGESANRGAAGVSSLTYAHALGALFLTGIFVLANLL